MDRRDNDFIFAGLKGSKDGQKQLMQKIQLEKEQIKVNKEREERSYLIQSYLRGTVARRGLQKRLEGELTKNLGDLDKLSQMLIQQKNQTFYLPINKVILLLRSFSVMRHQKKRTKPDET